MGGAGGTVGYDTVYTGVIYIYTSVQEVVRKIKTWKRDNVKRVFVVIKMVLVVLV